MLLLVALLTILGLMGRFGMRDRPMLQNGYVLYMVMSLGTCSVTECYSATIGMIGMGKY